jgi:hypothetical protein
MSVDERNVRFKCLNEIARALLGYVSSVFPSADRLIPQAPRKGNVTRTVDQEFGAMANQRRSRGLRGGLARSLIYSEPKQDRLVGPGAGHDVLSTEHAAEKLR